MGRSRGGLSTKLIAPPPHHGLQPEHLDAIEAFVAGHPDDSSTAARHAAKEDALRTACRLVGDSTPPDQ